MSYSRCSHHHYPATVACAAAVATAAAVAIAVTGAVAAVVRLWWLSWHKWHNQCLYVYNGWGGLAAWTKAIIASTKFFITSGCGGGGGGAGAFPLESELRVPDMNRRFWEDLHNIEGDYRALMQFTKKFATWRRVVGVIGTIC